MNLAEEARELAGDLHRVRPGGLVATDDASDLLVRLADAWELEHESLRLFMAEAARQLSTCQSDRDRYRETLKRLHGIFDALEDMAARPIETELAQRGRAIVSEAVS